MTGNVTDLSDHNHARNIILAGDETLGFGANLKLLTIGMRSLDFWTATALRF